jgi:hypothetical protein
MNVVGMQQNLSVDFALEPGAFLADDELVDWTG